MTRAFDQPGPSEREAALLEENTELKARLQELDDTLASIHAGEVDALVVSDAIYTLDSANVAANRLRQDVLSQMEECVFAFDQGNHVIYLNAAAERRYRVAFDQMLGRHRSEAFADAPFEQAEHVADSQLLRTHTLPDGSTVHVEAIESVLRDSLGNATGTLVVLRDVTHRLTLEVRRLAMIALADRLRDLSLVAEIEAIACEQIGQVLKASSVGYARVDEAAGTLTFVPDGQLSPAILDPVDVALSAIGSAAAALRQGQAWVVEDASAPQTSPAEAAWLARCGARSGIHLPVIEDARLVGLLFVHDARARRWTKEDMEFVIEVADRVRANAARARTEAALRDSEQRLRELNEGLEATVEARTSALATTEDALRQAQKMEAVGQLTGGIAHDFNNLLAGISSSMQVLQMRLRQGKFEGNERYIALAQEAVRRAAALTQRLLAFARRQTLDPKPVDANRLVASMEDLIRRTVGKNVFVEVVGAGGLWPTKVDASQLENSLLNLCINARDAMLPDGGRLTIETANKWLDQRAADERELPVGQYISLCVTDTGAGIAPDVIKRVFDPFFTTKPLGQGTGLGLSMVYGFVRQSGGQVRIYSELGKGTTMCLYLPRHVGHAGADDTHVEPEPVERGHGETVMVVEDEETIRSLIEEVLQEGGYRTLTAHDGTSAMQILQSPTRVDLLLTDVGLPGGMNGRQIADVEDL